jgi:hypothetical protein
MEIRKTELNIRLSRGIDSSKKDEATQPVPEEVFVKSGEEDSGTTNADNLPKLKMTDVAEALLSKEPVVSQESWSVGRASSGHCDIVYDEKNVFFQGEDYLYGLDKSGAPKCKFRTFGIAHTRAVPPVFGQDGTVYATAAIFKESSTRKCENKVAIISVKDGKEAWKHVIDETAGIPAMAVGKNEEKSEG